jgi:hypothetical protein
MISKSAATEFLPTTSDSAVTYYALTISVEFYMLPVNQFRCRILYVISKSVFSDELYAISESVLVSNSVYRQ